MRAPGGARAAVAPALPRAWGVPPGVLGRVVPTPWTLRKGREIEQRCQPGPDSSPASGTDLPLPLSLSQVEFSKQGSSSCCGLMHKLHWYQRAAPLLKLYTEPLHLQAGWKVLCPRSNHSQLGHLRGWVILPVRFPPQPLQSRLKNTISVLFRSLLWRRFSLENRVCQ